jgi:hypothetical protein
VFLFPDFIRIVAIPRREMTTADNIEERLKSKQVECERLREENNYRMLIGENLRLEKMQVIGNNRNGSLRKIRTSNPSVNRVALKIISHCSAVA